MCHSIITLTIKRKNVGEKHKKKLRRVMKRAWGIAWKLNSLTRISPKENFSLALSKSWDVEGDSNIDLDLLCQSLIDEHSIIPILWEAT